ncbi:carbohydrate kinase [Hydrotalea sp.]|uniref:carbohydrate kinase family protein n=2 Tax=Hydrotalea sp. TaxID=2881279 RepID=UPI002619D7AF|nr:carbohydrate kinase [Hydrotalea sp.]
MQTIICIGEALIDMICTDKGKTLEAGEHFLKKTGGAPTNVAAAIAALGGRVELAAKVGADPFGQQLIHTMQEFGVNTQWMCSSKEHFTTFAFVSLKEDGERDFVFNRGADGHLMEQEITDILNNGTGIVHFGSATAFLPGPLKTTYTNLLTEAKTKNCFVSFDPNYRHLLFAHRQQSFIEQSLQFLKVSNFFKVSDEEAMLLSGKSTVNDAANWLLKYTDATFCITLGREGTLLCFQQQQILIPSIKVEVVDTTGAGDAFVGAVLYQLSCLEKNELPQLPAHQWQEIVLNANKAGARTCAYMGAMEAFKYLSSDIFKA